MISTLGLVLFMNQTKSKHTFNVATCSLDARWAKAKSIIKSSPPSSLLAHEFHLGRVRNTVAVGLGHNTNGFLKANDHFKFDPEVMTEISLDVSWYDLFSPVIPESMAGTREAGTGNQTTMERILEAARSGDPTYVLQIQQTVATAMADGLSRSGMIPNRDINRALGAWEFGDWGVSDETLARKLVRYGKPLESHSLPEALQDRNTTRMEMQAEYTGYAMIARDWFDFFCVAVLMAHALIALGHTLFVCWRRETSSAWDTILELVALAYKSPPPADSEVLSNTCAGVSSFKTISAVAWVEESGEAEGEQLRLRFKEDGIEKRGEAV